MQNEVLENVLGDRDDYSIEEQEGKIKYMKYKSQVLEMKN